jgi:hypothetical protein
MPDLFKDLVRALHLVGQLAAGPVRLPVLRCNPYLISRCEVVGPAVLVCLRRVPFLGLSHIFPGLVPGVVKACHNSPSFFSV